MKNLLEAIVVISSSLTALAKNSSIPKMYDRTTHRLGTEGAKMSECFAKATWQSKIYTKELKATFALLLKYAELENSNPNTSLNQEEAHKRREAIYFLSDKVHSLLEYNYCSQACKDDVRSFTDELKTWSLYKFESPIHEQKPEELRIKLLKKIEDYQADLALNDAHHHSVLKEY